MICICGIAKFETGALYITYNFIINDSSRCIFLIGGLIVITETIAPVWRVEDDPFGSRAYQLQHKTVLWQNVDPVCCAAFLRLVSFQAQRQHLKGSIYHCCGGLGDMWRARVLWGFLSTGNSSREFCDHNEWSNFIRPCHTREGDRNFSSQSTVLGSIFCLHCTLSTPPSTTGVLQVECRISSNLRLSRKGWIFERRTRVTQGISKHKNFSWRALWNMPTRTHLEGLHSVDLRNHTLQLCPRAPRAGVSVGIWRLPIGTDIVPHIINFVKLMKPVWWMVEKRGHIFFLLDYSLSSIVPGRNPQFPCDNTLLTPSYIAIWETRFESQAFCFG